MWSAFSLTPSVSWPVSAINCHARRGVELGEVFIELRLELVADGAVSRKLVIRLQVSMDLSLLRCECRIESKIYVVNISSQLKYYVCPKKSITFSTQFRKIKKGLVAAYPCSQAPEPWSQSG